MLTAAQIKILRFSRLAQEDLGLIELTVAKQLVSKIAIDVLQGTMITNETAPFLNIPGVYERVYQDVRAENFTYDVKVIFTCQDNYLYVLDVFTMGVVDQRFLASLKRTATEWLRQLKKQ